MHSSPLTQTKYMPSLFLQALIVLAGAVTLGALIWEPQLEGKNVGAPLADIYFKDPFIMYIYVASIPFFVALYKAFSLLSLIGQDQLFSNKAIKAVRSIFYCAGLIAASTIGADIYIFMTARQSHDDGAGAIMLGMIIVFICMIVAAATILAERVLIKTMAITAEHDLTV